MNPAAKHFDIVMGVDIHIVQPPGPVPPLPIPHPFIGLVWDPMDYVPVLGASVLVNGVPRAQAGSAAKEMPVHFPIGGTFVKPPGNEGEMFMGSSTVLAEDEPFTYNALQVLSCHCVGLVPPPRSKKKGGTKTMSLPTSMVLPIPAGKQILVGGPPTISMSAMGMKLAMAGVGKAAKKFKGKKKVKSKAPKKPSPKTSKCTTTGHPVNVADGSVFTSITDFEITGPIPLKWERFWFSNKSYTGPLGGNWFHKYDQAVVVCGDEVLIRMEEGRVLTLPFPGLGESIFNREERITLFNNGDVLCYRNEERLNYYFPLAKDVEISETHNLVKIEDQNGFAIKFEYLSNGSLSKIIDSAGRIFLFASNDDGQIIKIEAPHPTERKERFVIQSYCYNELGQLVVANDALMQPMKYKYEGGLLVKETNRNGLSFYFEYEGVGELARCYHTWGDGGIYEKKLFFSEGLTIVEDFLGYRISYYHRNGLVYKTVDPYGGVSTTSYNEYNELVGEKDQLGNGPLYRYDQQGNCVATIAADGAVFQTCIDENGLPTLAIDPMGGEWKWEYDQQGNTIRKTNPLGHCWTYRYVDGLLIEMKDPLNGLTFFNYDNFANLTRLITPDANATWWTYDFLGHLVERVDAKGNSERRILDLSGRTTEICEIDGVVRKLLYDGEGNVILAKDRYREVKFVYTGMNKLKIRSESGTQIEFQYDKEERLVGFINEQKLSYSFKLDANGNVESEHGFDKVCKYYIRDWSGRVIELQQSGDVKSYYEYDQCGRILNIRHSDGNENYFVYRADGRLVEAKNEHVTIKIERDILGQIICEKQNQYFVCSVYNELGMRNNLTTSFGANIKIGRDVIGDINFLESESLNVSFKRDMFGQELERDFSDILKVRWKRDVIGRPVRFETLTKDGSISRERCYHWENIDRLSRIKDSKNGLTVFGHDLLGNLSWVKSPNDRTLYKMPDTVGNLYRTRSQDDRDYGPGGNLIRDKNIFYYYDGEGNLIRKVDDIGREWKYKWNSSGFLQEIIRPDKEVVIFAYDPFGRRIAKQYKGRKTTWVWDGDMTIHEWQEPTFMLNGTVGLVEPSDQRSGSESKSNIITWVFDPKSFAPVAKLESGKSFGIVTDHLGTPLSMHDHCGRLVWSADIDCYGEVVSLHGRIGDCPFRFPGQYEDIETGLYYNRFRYYDPSIGSYISQDPIGLLGGGKLYGYVMDSLVFIDPFGLNKAPILFHSDNGVVHPKTISSKNPNGVFTVDASGSYFNDKAALSKKARIKDPGKNWSAHHIDYDPKTNTTRMQFVYAPNHKHDHTGGAHDFKENTGFKYGSDEAVIEATKRNRAKSKSC